MTNSLALWSDFCIPSGATEILTDDPLSVKFDLGSGLIVTLCTDALIDIDVGFKYMEAAPEGKLNERLSFAFSRAEHLSSDIFLEQRIDGFGDFLLSRVRKEVNRNERETRIEAWNFLPEFPFFIEGWRDYLLRAIKPNEMSNRICQHFVVKEKQGYFGEAMRPVEVYFGDDLSFRDQFDSCKSESLGHADSPFSREEKDKYSINWDAYYKDENNISDKQAKTVTQSGKNIISNAASRLFSGQMIDFSELDPDRFVPAGATWQNFAQYAPQEWQLAFADLS
jgi:hypothetical protein